MILVTGGIASGKRGFVESIGFSKREIADAALDGRPVVCNAQELVRPDGCDPEALARCLAREKRVVICTEVGGGIVPADAGERAWRERAGALGRELALRADAVVRMVCGIPVAVKGEVPEGR